MSLGLNSRAALWAAIAAGVCAGAGASNALAAMAQPDIASTLTDTTQVFISTKNQDEPAVDLMQNGQPLTEQAALALKASGVDLSMLDPNNTTDFWPGVDTSADESLDEALPIQPGATVTYVAPVLSEVSFRMNVLVQNPGQAPQMVTLMLSRDVHTFLLRKELLRRLGYRIPQMKYVSNLKIVFPDQATWTNVCSNLIPGSPGGGLASNWVPGLAPANLNMPSTATAGTDATDPGFQAEVTAVCDYSRLQAIAPAGSNPLEVPFQDMVAIQATPLYSNVVTGPPVADSAQLQEGEPDRTLRSLALPYELVDIPENVNLANWYVGQVGNDFIGFTVDQVIANFGCTMDDANWILRRIAALTRDDFTKIVAGAYYPAPVAQLIVEKLISRRDSMMTLFGLKEPAIAFNPKISTPSTAWTFSILGIQLFSGGGPPAALQNGQLVQQSWPGYASLFASSDPTSPLADIWDYVLSQGEGNLTSNLLATANSAIPGFTINGDLASHQQTLVQNAYNQYLATGQAQPVPFGVWAGPIANGSLTLSRNVVFGNYLGMNNLVQLVDTLGVTVNLGLVVGVDGLPSDLGIAGQILGSVSISLAHVKPLQDLKESITEPIQNELVALLFHNAASELSAIASEQPSSADTPTQLQALQAKIQGQLEQLTDFLGVGESLVLTASISGSQSVNVSIGASAPLSPSASVTGSANQLVLSRLNIYRKNTDTVQVFNDTGELAGVSLAFQGGVQFASILPQFPVLSISAQSVVGDGKVQVYTVNLDQNTANNPNFFSEANGLASSLNTGSTTLLASVVKPAVVSANFNDSSSGFQLFSFVNRTLTANGKIHVQLPDGTADDYVSLSDGSQTGESIQSLGQSGATQVAAYIASRLTAGAPSGVNINTQVAPDPGQSFLGNSTTTNASLQAQVSGTGLSSRFVQVQSRWEGWNISQADMQKLTDTLNSQYGFILYPDGFLQDAQSLQMYQLSLFVNFYESAVTKLLSMSTQDAQAVFDKYNDYCSDPPWNKGNYPPDPGGPQCIALEKFQDAFSSYQRGITDPVKLGQAVMQIVGGMAEFCDFTDLVERVGGADNLFVTATLTGFRNGSQMLSNPINSSTLGTADPYTPNGIVSSVEQLLGINDGEFDMQWIRQTL